MMDYNSFIALHPEFSKTGIAQVNGELTAAALLHPVAIWGTLADSGTRYLTAHRLALSPFGQAARLVNAKDGTTTYETHYKKLCTIVGCGSGFAA
jgi:hypothetical protein